MATKGPIACLDRWKSGGGEFFLAQGAAEVDRLMLDDSLGIS